MGDMRKTLSVLRIVIEGLLGLFFMLAVLAQLPRYVGALASSLAYALGGLAGSLILGVLGYYLIRDAMRVAERVRSKVPTES